jgi:CO dehydrogenase nickel-insertion accessory protein CooC1
MTNLTADILSPEPLSIATNVLDGTERPLVRVIVEGQVGSGKSAILAILLEVLQGKATVVLADEYTQAELKLEAGTDYAATLKMYNPTIVLQERVVKPEPKIARTPEASV